MKKFLRYLAPVCLAVATIVSITAQVTQVIISADVVKTDTLKFSDGTEMGTAPGGANAVQFRGKYIDIAAPADGQIYVYNSTADTFKLATPARSGTMTTGDPVYALGTDSVGTRKKFLDYHTFIDSTAINFYSTNLKSYFFRAPYALTIDSMWIALTGVSGDSVAVDVRHSPNMDGSTTDYALITSPTKSYSRTTGQTYTSFNDNTVQTGHIVRVEIDSKTGNPKGVAIAIYGRKD